MHEEEIKRKLMAITRNKGVLMLVRVVKMVTSYVSATRGKQLVG
jgi:hypothetical protein